MKDFMIEMISGYAARSMLHDGDERVWSASSTHIRVSAYRHPFNVATGSPQLTLSHKVYEI